MKTSIVRIGRTFLTVILAVVVVLGPQFSAAACCMVPRDYKGTIGQSAQEGVLFYEDGREELILKINYRITGETMPDRFTWIITVPNELEVGGGRRKAGDWRLEGVCANI